MGDGAGARRGGKGRSSAGRLRGCQGQVGRRAAEARSGPNGFGAPPVTRRTLGAGDSAHSQTRAGLGVCALAGGGLQVSVLSTRPSSFNVVFTDGQNCHGCWLGRPQKRAGFSALSYIK